MHCLCGTSNKKEVKHPLKSGLMVDGELVFIHEYDIFCKDFLKDDNHIYIFGGQVGEREQRAQHDGIVFILDNNYNLKEKIIFSNTGGFSGASF